MEYIEHRERAGLSPNSIWKEIAALSAVFSYARQLGIVEINPCLGVKKPKLELVRPNRTPSAGEVVRILQHMKPRPRRYCITLFATGCRRAELSNCNVGDFDVENRLLTIVRKGGRVRTIPLNDEAVRGIQAELAERPRAKPDEPLFKGKYGARVKTIRKTLMTACEKAGVLPVTHHGLRHAFATELKKKKIDLLTLSRLMGHSSVVITDKLYIEDPTEDMHKASQKLSIGVDPNQKVVQKVVHNVPKKNRKR